ncbi:nucleoside triphosphate pyrophosphohydrolase family protein [Nisaea sediminum]|uniref:pyrophosphatase n=1 Tax=Nisaea sediminum TaxID=2775867 RepID=UPI001866CC21|nr:pyrophosphatase [Nisaea sediminum]
MLKSLTGKFERASQDYALGFGIERDPDWYLLKLQEELGELTQVWNRYSDRGRRGDLSNEDLHLALENEAADVLGHILLFAHRFGLDLPSAIERKWRFRPEPTEKT